MHDLAVAGHQQLRVGQQAGVEIAVLQQRVGARQSVGIEAMRAGVGQMYAQTNSSPYLYFEFPVRLLP